MSTLNSRALLLYKPPFTYLNGYVYDADLRMVSDNDGGDADPVRVRGWGRISYLPDAEALQDEVGAIIARALTAYWCMDTIPKTLGEERLLFEAHARKLLGEDSLFIRRYAQDDDPKYAGRYKNGGVQTSWEGWLAHAGLVDDPQQVDTVLDEEFIIYLDAIPIDVVKHYRETHKMDLPPEPTMSGEEIRKAGGGHNQTYELHYDGPNPAQSYTLGNRQSLSLVNGMNFYTVPPATMNNVSRF